MLAALDHLTLAVADLDGAVDAYRTLLGYAPAWRGGHPGLGTRAALFRLANTVLELVSPEAGAMEAEGLRALLASRGEGLVGLSFGCEDATGAAAALRARGVRTTLPEAGEACGDDGERRRFRVVTLSPRSTRGLALTLVERNDPLPGFTPQAAASLSALDHVVVRTSDPDAAIGLYRDALGIRLALDRAVAGTRMLFFRIGGVTLEFVNARDAGAEDTLHGLAFRTLDADAAHARLAAAGLAVDAVRDGRKAGTRVFGVRGGTSGIPTLVLRDPAREVSAP